MPVDYKRYPTNWKSEIRPFILKRANECCEFCGLKNGQTAYRFKEGNEIKWYPEKVIGHQNGKFIGECTVVLTIAHLDHDETNQNVEYNRLAALCQKCHLKYDAKEKEKRKREGYDRSVIILHPKDLPDEIWKPIEGYEGIYLISNMGRIKTLRQTSLKKGKYFINQFLHRKGYAIASLFKDKKQWTVKVHRLVAIHFVSNEKKLPEVNHKDCNKLNNRASNLEWVSSSYNQIHSYANNRRERMKGVLQHRAKLNNESVLEIINTNTSAQELAKKYNITKGSIYKVRNGRSWNHVTKKKKVL